MEDNVGQLGSLKGKSHLVKAKSLSDCLGMSSETNVKIEERVGKSDHVIEGCKNEKLFGRVGIGHFYLTDCAENDVDYLKQPSSVISTVRNSVLEADIHAERTSRVTPCRDGLDNNVESEASAPFTVVKKSSVRSDLCSDSGQHGQTKGNDFVDGYPPSTNEIEVKSSMQTTFHDKQCKSESSSSNSGQVTLPASSKGSCQEMSVCKSSYEFITPTAVDTSTCMNFKLEQPAFRSLVPDMDVHVLKYQLDAIRVLSEERCNDNRASELIDKVRTRDGGKVLGLTPVNRCVSGGKINDLKSDLPKKKIAEHCNKIKSEICYDLGDDDALEVAWRVAKDVEQEIEASGSSSSIPGRSRKEDHLSSVDSAGSHGEGCLTESGSIHQKCNESDSFCSTKETMDIKPVTKKEELPLEVKEAVDGIVLGTGDGCQRQGSSRFAIKMEGVAASNQTSHVFGIDLNEDIMQNEEEYPQKPIKETVSLLENVSKPIPVLAKSGIPLCLPVPQFLSEWDLGGWRGSAATSAFKPTSFSESCNRNALSTNDTNCSSIYSHVKGIDLNVAAPAAELDVELLCKKPIPALPCNCSKESSVEVNSRQARMLDIDLNCVSEIGDGSQHLSPLASVRDFDLNDKSSADACNGPYQTCVGSLGLRNRESDDPAVSSLEYSKQSDCKTIRSTHSQDLSSREGFSHRHDRPFLVAATNMVPSYEQLQRMAALQHKVAFSTPQPPPPHTFLYNNGFCIDPTNSLSAAVYPPSFLPYMTDPHASIAIPQYFGSGTVPVFPMAPHLMGVPHGSAPNDTAFIRPTFDLNMGANSLENGSRRVHGRQVSLPPSDATMEEHMKSFQQVGLTAIPMKRREPDGGWDSHQLFFR